MRLFLGALLMMVALGVVSCGRDNPCEKLLKYYCEEKQDKNLCQVFTDRVNAGMSKEACESSLGQAK